LPEPSYVSLSVYDILGKEVAKLVDKELTEGYYNIQWDAGNYPSGIYIYRISTNKYSEIKKMLLVK